MKAMARLWLAGAIAILAALPAHAERGQRLHQFLQERQRDPQAQREFRREQRQAAQERGRLSPEERRQLREDIQNANQNVYRRGLPAPPPPPAPPSPPRPF